MNFKADDGAAHDTQMNIKGLAAIALAYFTLVFGGGFVLLKVPMRA